MSRRPVRSWAIPGVATRVIVYHFDKQLRFLFAPFFKAFNRANMSKCSLGYIMGRKEIYKFLPIDGWLYRINISSVPHLSSWKDILHQHLVALFPYEA